MTWPPDPNQGASAALLNQAETKVAGASDLYIAYATTPSVLHYFGQQMDDTPISWRDFYNDVPGDSHGGPQGPPIDRQVLGRIATINFTLSIWSQEVRYQLERHGGAFQTNGFIHDTEIGALLFTLHAWRVLIVPRRGDPMNANPGGPEDYFFTYNFPCALLSTPIEAGQGTKYSALRFTLEAHRAPPASEKRGVIWDRDATGWSAAVAERDAMVKAMIPPPPQPATA